MSYGCHIGHFLRHAGALPGIVRRLWDCVVVSPVVARYVATRAASVRRCHAACCEPVLKNWTAALHDEMRRHNESACRALPDASGRKSGVLRLAGSSRRYELGVGVVRPTSMRWPSGSRMYAR